MEQFLDSLNKLQFSLKQDLVSHSNAIQGAYNSIVNYRISKIEKKSSPDIFSIFVDTLLFGFFIEGFITGRVLAPVFKNFVKRFYVSNYTLVWRNTGLVQNIGIGKNAQSFVQLQDYMKLFDDKFIKSNIKTPELEKAAKNFLVKSVRGILNEKNEKNRKSLDANSKYDSVAELVFTQKSILSHLITLQDATFYSLKDAASLYKEKEEAKQLNLSGFTSLVDDLTKVPNKIIRYEQLLKTYYELMYLAVIGYEKLAHEKKLTRGVINRKVFSFDEEDSIIICKKYILVKYQRKVSKIKDPNHFVGCMYFLEKILKQNAKPISI